MINSGSEVRAHLAAIGCNGQEISRAHLAAIGCNGLTCLAYCKYAQGTSVSMRYLQTGLLNSMSPVDLLSPTSFFATIIALYFR